MFIRIVKNNRVISEIDDLRRLYAVISYYAHYYFCGNMVIEYVHDDGHIFRESVIHYCEFEGIPLKIREEEYNV